MGCPLPARSRPCMFFGCGSACHKAGVTCPTLPFRAAGDGAGVTCVVRVFLLIRWRGRHRGSAAAAAGSATGSVPPVRKLQHRCRGGFGAAFFLRLRVERVSFATASAASCAVVPTAAAAAPLSAATAAATQGVAPMRRRAARHGCFLLRPARAKKLPRTCWSKGYVYT